MNDLHFWRPQWLHFRWFCNKETGAESRVWKWNLIESTDVLKIVMENCTIIIFMTNASGIGRNSEFCHTAEHCLPTYSDLAASRPLHHTGGSRTVRVVAGKWCVESLISQDNWNCIFCQMPFTLTVKRWFFDLFLHISQWDFTVPQTLEKANIFQKRKHESVMQLVT